MRLLHCSIYSLLMILWITAGHAGYLHRIPVTVQQPNGTLVHCFATGDEFHSWLHDENNYTIIQDDASRYYVFATLKVGQLTPTSFLPGRDDPARAGLIPGANIAPEQWAKKRTTILSKYPVRVSKAPTTGTISNIVIFIRFSDQEEFAASPAEYSEMFNASDEGVSSLHNYFREVSYGALDVSSTFYPISTGATVLSYQDSEPRAYYTPYSSTNPLGYTGENQGIREQTLLRRSVDAIADQVPNNLIVDDNNDGYVDNICFIVRGSPTVWGTILWPHAGSMISDEEHIIAGKKVASYNLQVESEAREGVLCHEMMHSLGAPDLYEYSYRINPVGVWDLMAETNNPPQHPSTYLKYKYLKWISSIPEISASGSYTLNPTTNGSNNCFRIASPNSSGEYFVLEYRRRTGIFDWTLPGEGLIIYRINPAGVGDLSLPHEVYIYRPGGTTSATGEIYLAGLSSTEGRTSINDETNPSSFLSDGTPGGLNISDVGALGPSITFRVSVGTAPLLSSISPTHINAGGPADTIDAWGENFIASSVVQFNGVGKKTTFLSATHLQAVITSRDLAIPGVYPITVVNTGGDTSNALMLTVNEVPPGSLAVSVSNAEGWPMVGTATVELYGVNGQLVAGRNTTTGSPAVFDSVPAGVNFWYDVRYNSVPAKYWGEEYWGRKTAVTILSGQTTNESFIRNTPYVTDVLVYDSSSNQKVTSAVAVGTPLKIEITVKNPNNPGSLNWPVIFVGALIDRDEMYPYDDTVSGTLSAIRGTSNTMSSYFRPMGSGLYRYNAGLRIYPVDDRVVGCDGSAWAFLVDVAPHPLVITSSSPLPPGTVGSTYASSLSAAGGMPPYSWSVAGGSLPHGLVLASDGNLAGTPDSTGTSTFTVKVADAADSSATKALSLTTMGPQTGALAITVVNAEDWSPIATEGIVRLYDTTGVLVATGTTDTNSTAFFENLKAPRSYRYRVWYSLQTPRGEEYWGQKDSVGVSHEQTTRESFKRNAPYVRWTKILDTSSGKEITGALAVGTPLRLVLDVKNPADPGARNQAVAFSLHVDRDTTAPYDFADSTVFASMDAGTEIQRAFLFTPRDTGIYKGRSHVDCLLDSLPVTCFGNTWLTLFSSTLPVPEPLTLCFPSHNSVVSSDSVRLEWMRGTPAVERYEVDCAFDSLFTSCSVDTNVSDTTLVVRRLGNNMWHFWRVRAQNASGWGHYSEVGKFRTMYLGVDIANGIPTVFGLHQNYPNPFNPTTTIRYAVAHRSHVLLTVSNTLGQEVAELVNCDIEAGYHSVQFNARNLASGVYFYRLTAGSFTTTKSMLLVR